MRVNVCKWSVAIIGFAIASVIGVPAQTKRVAKPVTPVQKETAVSEPFAKAGLHLLLAMNLSGLDDAGQAHVTSLLEEVKMVESTELETSLTKLWRDRYDKRRVNQIILKYLSDKGVTGAPFDKEMADAARNNACIAAYIPLVKANDKAELGVKTPDECKLK